MRDLLRVEALDVRYGDSPALTGVSLTVAEGATAAVIGANGAGKTTLLRTIAGQLRPHQGTISYGGRDVTGLAARRRARLGIALVPEGRRLFPSLTVDENLRLGAYGRRPRGFWEPDRVYQLFPHLAGLRGERAATLSGGEAQAVAIGRALAADPRLLLLDEVSLGLAPVVVQSLYAALPAIKEAGATVLVVEQDVGRALRVADTVHCLLAGRLVLESPAAGVSRAAIAHAYLGEPA